MVALELGQAMDLAARLVGQEQRREAGHVITQHHSTVERTALLWGQQKNPSLAISRCAMVIIMTIMLIYGPLYSNE